MRNDLLKAYSKTLALCLYLRGFSKTYVNFKQPKFFSKLFYLLFYFNFMPDCLHSHMRLDSKSIHNGAWLCLILFLPFLHSVRTPGIFKPQGRNSMASSFLYTAFNYCAVRLDQTILFLK